MLVSQKPLALTCFAGLGVVTAGGGCGLLDDTLDVAGSGRVEVFALHHGTPDDGEFPILAPHDEADWRVFENDRGQEIRFADGFRSFQGVDLIGCDGSSHPLELQYGRARFESFCDTHDLLSTTLGWANVPAGDYCNIDIHYGPYQFPPPGGSSKEPRPDVPDMDGMTAMVRITEEDEGNQIEWADDFEMTVTRSLEEIENGSPLGVRTGDTNANRLAVTITYDRLLDGVDLTKSNADVEDAVKDGLREYTGVMWNTSLEDPEAIFYDE
ncbi:MAG: hypothetical protein B7733_12820 [Myxococcales bacterium FL481]|nr:MAG: hypothetical protein B7733_12820 [Myxococcales bacterium FL481]